MKVVSRSGSHFFFALTPSSRRQWKGNAEGKSRLAAKPDSPLSRSLPWISGEASSSSTGPFRGRSSSDFYSVFSFDWIFISSTSFWKTSKNLKSKCLFQRKENWGNFRTILACCVVQHWLKDPIHMLLLVVLIGYLPALVQRLRTKKQEIVREMKTHQLISATLVERRWQNRQRIFEM